jgi:hypothetical protein
MVNNRGHILHKMHHKKGRSHDYDIYKRNHPIIPEQLSALPYRNKKNQKLSQEEKEYNKIHSRKRIVIEHTICRLKKYRIMSDVFRNRLRKYNRISDIVTGLVNYRMMNHQN